MPVSHRNVTGVLTVALVCLTTPARGDEITVHSSLVGGFDAFGGYDNTFASQNYFTGSTATGPQPDRRSFYIFSLPAMLPAPVTAATLVLRNPWAPFPDGSGGSPGYFSDDASETFRISDTPFPAGFIAAPHSTAEAMSIWATLGSGTPYGSAVVGPAAGHSRRSRSRSRLQRWRTSTATWAERSSSAASSSLWTAPPPTN